jgi:lipoate-protein ligase A
MEKSKMPGFNERFPEIISSNPVPDVLGESVLDVDQPAVRLFEPAQTMVVIGRSQDPTRECFIDHCVADGVPIYRRASGGGAVVLSLGMLVIALRLPWPRQDADCVFAKVNDACFPVIAATSGVQLSCRGHGDWARETAPGTWKKVLGTSLRQRANDACYLGVLLLSDAIPLMQRYLASPSRQPDYRQNREHADFCTHLSETTPAKLSTALMPVLEELTVRDSDASRGI